MGPPQNFLCVFARMWQRQSDSLQTADGHAREVVNYDVDLMDCTVLACVLAAYCPFLVSGLQFKTRLCNYCCYYIYCWPWRELFSADISVRFVEIHVGIEPEVRELPMKQIVHVPGKGRSIIMNMFYRCRLTSQLCMLTHPVQSSALTMHWSWWVHSNTLASAMTARYMHMYMLLHIYTCTCTCISVGWYIHYVHTLHTL